MINSSILDTHITCEVLCFGGTLVSFDGTLHIITKDKVVLQFVGVEGCHRHRRMLSWTIANITHGVFYYRTLLMYTSHISAQNKNCIIKTLLIISSLPRLDSPACCCCSSILFYCTYYIIDNQFY